MAMISQACAGCKGSEAWEGAIKHGDCAVGSLDRSTAQPTKPPLVDSGDADKIRGD